MAITCAVIVDTAEATEVTGFIRRNMAFLKKNPALRDRIQWLLENNRAFLVLPTREGLVAELSYPMIEAVTLMQRRGCR
jgi:hypothetical protein